MAFNLGNIAFQNNFGIFNQIPKNNFDLNSLFQGLKPQESGLEQAWRQLRDYQPSTTEKVALAALAAASLAKISDEVANQIKLWKRNVREQKAAAAVNQGRWAAGGATDRIIQFFTPKSTQVDEYFRFDAKDVRPKFLYLSAEFDYISYTSGATRSLNPQTEAGGPLDPEHVSQLLSSFDNDFDLKFSLVGSYEDICNEIEEGGKTGKLLYVMIDGHGSANGRMIVLSMDPNDRSSKLLDEAVLKSNPTCFTKLHPLGRILLSSCCTGSPVTGCSNNPGEPKRPTGTENIAEALSDFAQRTVVAPTISIYGKETKVETTFPDPIMLTHPDTTYKKPNENVFKIFNPKVRPPTTRGCRDLSWDKLHPREIEAMDAIKTVLVGKSLLSSSAQFHETQEYLRVCKEDPKLKVLYLSAEHDLNGALEPKESGLLLSSLAQNYDLQFKVISTFDEICHVIANASKTGKIAGVVIDAHGSTNGLILSQITPQKNAKLAPSIEWIDDKKDFATCFAPLYPSGKIVFVGGSAGAPQGGDRNDNLAQKVATKSNLQVAAPIHTIYGRAIRLSSERPFTVFHPRNDNPSENAFQEFVPGEPSKMFLHPNCLTKECSNLNEKDLHPRASAVMDAIKKQASFWTRWRSTSQSWQETLRLRADDPRPKFLYLTGKYDPNGALDPNHDLTLLSTIANDFDLRYAVIDSWKDICHSIHSAAKIGKVANVLISAHRSGESIYLSERKDGNITKNLDDSGCFSDLPIDARIILNTSAGSPAPNGNIQESLAQNLADAANRTVVSALDNVTGKFTSLLTKQPFMLFHPSKSDPKTNMFMLFSPSKNGRKKGVKDEL